VKITPLKPQASEQKEQIKKAQILTSYEMLDIGPVPNGEICAQLGADNYEKLSKIESKAYANQIQRMFPDMPYGVFIKRTSNPHDFGTYYELAIQYDINEEEAVEFVNNIEGNLPEEWDDQARQELTEQGYFQELQEI
jgi:hypothetical protein